jgi:hypothetical protein
MNKPSIKRIPFQEIRANLRQEIDDFNERFQGTIFHETAFNSITSEVQGTRLSYYLAYTGGELAGICPCHTYDKGLVKLSFSNLTSFDLPYGGWVYDNGRINLNDLISRTRVGYNEMMQISSNIEVSEAIPYKGDGIRQYTTGKTVILKLEGSSEDELFEALKHAQKNKIRKAAKMGVEIVNSPPERIGEFYDLLAELKNNVNKEVSPQDYYQRIYAHYYAQGRATCLIARYGEENISSLIMLANKSFATIWFGGRKIGIPNNLYQNELMIWEAVKWSHSFGSKYFDLCTLDEQRYPQLARIKLSFSKDLRPYYYYSLKGPAFKLLNKVQGKVR